MRVFLYKVLSIGLPVIAMLAMVNYWGDAARIFSADYENKIVSILLSHRSATNISNYNERLLQQEWIKKIPFTPDITVIGSSKAMLVDSGMIRGYRLINNSVSGATLTDIENIYRLYLAARNIPRRIIIGIDPWTLNNDATQQHIARKAGDHKNSDDRQTGFDKITTLFSLTYFQHSFPVLLLKIRGRDQPIATTEKYNISNTKNPDGSLTYGDAYRNSSEAAVASRVELYVKRGDVDDLDLLNSVSASKWKQLSRLIDDMQMHHIQVHILLTPYYPSIYKMISRRFPSGLRAEHMLGQLAGQKKLTLTGSFDPEKCGLSTSDFYDAVHGNEHGLSLILSKLVIH